MFDIFGASYWLKKLEAFGLFLYKQGQNISKKRRDKVKEDRPAELRDPALTEWITNYYRSKSDDGHILTLYNSENGKAVDYPFLAKYTWLPLLKGEAGSLVTTLDKNLISDFPVDEKFVERERRLGRRLVDNPSYSFAKITAEGNELRLICGICSYLQYFSLCGRIADETRSQYRNGLDISTPIRDLYAPDLDTLTKTSHGALAIGVSVAVVFEDSIDGTLRIILQERSLEVVSTEGMIAPIPQFAFQPTIFGYEELECDLRHNFLRELAEELYDQPEIRDYSSKRIKPDWFYPYAPIKDLLEDDSSMEIKVVGFGFDALNGEPNIAVVVRMASDQFFRKEKFDPKGSWESKHISSFKLEDPTLTSMLMKRKVTGLGALCIIGAISIYGSSNSKRFQLRLT